MNLDPAQIRAVTFRNGPCMVLAGPGSGKTTVITKRIEYLIKECHVSPGRILVVTFSRAAANEMRERFRELDAGRGSGVTFGTFHGIYYGILKREYRLTSDNILSEEEKKRIIRKIAGYSEDDENDEFMRSAAGEIGALKSNLIPLTEYRPRCCDAEEFVRIYNGYEAEKKRLGKIDFDDMIVLALELFGRKGDVLARWQRVYSHILIDEFQDINKAQYEVARMLAQPENNLFAVGDDDQSIYGFRGASPKIMLNFPEDYPNAGRIILNVNYRSSGEIVKSASNVISNNSSRFAKRTAAVNPDGDKVGIVEAENPVEESKTVANMIRGLIGDGVNPGDIAVLFRTNTEARVFAETFAEYDIRFRMRERIPNIYEHFAARDLITYMRMSLGDRSRKSFLRIANRPVRYIGRESMDSEEISFEELKKYYAGNEQVKRNAEKLEEDLGFISECAPYAAICYIRKAMGYDDFLAEYTAKRHIGSEGPSSVISQIEERAREFRDIGEWLAYTDEYTAALKHKKNEAGDGADPEAVDLMTMHGAKGLEYGSVFICCANEGVIPYRKAETDEEIEEERRMFYVAMTRAKRRLVISYSRQRNGKDAKPSGFIAELSGQETANHVE